LTNIYFLRK